MPRVAWSKLPQVRALAPEFYNNLYFHTSWSGLFVRFLFDPNLSLYSRVVRGETAEALSRRPAATSVEEVIARAAPGDGFRHHDSVAKRHRCG